MGYNRQQNKMKKLWNVLAVIMVIMLGVVITSCKNNDNDVEGGGSGSDSGSGSISSDIVGTWMASGNNATVTLVFKADGTGSFSYYHVGSKNSEHWWRTEGVFTTWKLSGNTVTAQGGYWTSINYEGETDNGTNNWTLEYNGTTLSGGRYHITPDDSPTVYHKQ